MYGNVPGYDLWVLPLDGQRKPWLFLKTPFTEKYGAFSPDGRWLAYQSDESGLNEIYVRPFVDPGASTAGAGPTAIRAGGQWQVSTTGGAFPRWRADGKELFYLAPDGQLMGAPIALNGTTLELGAPAALFQTHIVGGGADLQQGRYYDVTRDGRFLINTELASTAAPIRLLMNWAPDVKK